MPYRPMVVMLALLAAACGGRVDDDAGAQGPIQAAPSPGPGAGSGGGPGGSIPSGDDAGAAGASTDGVDAATVCPGAPGPGTGVDASLDGCPCTRRPGPGNSWQCAMGANESASAVIGPSGGTVSLMGQQGAASGVAMTLQIPPGALASDTTITITETNVPPPASFLDWSPVWRFEPLGLTFAAHATIQMPWGNLSGPVDPALATYWSADGCTWERRADSYVNAGFMNASIVALGYGFAGSPRTAATASCP